MLYYAATKIYQDNLLQWIIYDATFKAIHNDRNTPLDLTCGNSLKDCVKALIFSTPEVKLNIENLISDSSLHLTTIL